MNEEEKPKLKPAEENPWYVLATLYGEEPNYLIQSKNQRVWNAWATHELNDEEKQRIILENKFPCANWDAIKDEVTELFGKRLPNLELPKLGYIFFNDIEFSKEVDLSNYIFTGPVIFDNTVFLSQASFSRSHFKEFTSFSSTIFKKSVGFNQATFSSETFFRDTIFQRSVNFIRTVFEGDVDFSVVFEEASSFYNCSFNERINLMTSKFKNAYPVLIGTNLDEKAILFPFTKNWPKLYNCEQDSFEAKESCATLRHIMNLQGRSEQAHFFFRREMQFASKLGSIWQRFPYLLFGWFSYYGHSLKRPTWALAMLWFFPAMVYWPYLCSGVYTDIFSLEFWNSVVRTSALSFGLSLGNLFQFTGLQRVYLIDIIGGLPWGLKFLGGVQTLLAIPLLFLLLLGLRNRFRLK